MDDSAGPLGQVELTGSTEETCDHGKGGQNVLGAFRNGVWQENSVSKARKGVSGGEHSGPGVPEG